MFRFIKKILIIVSVGTYRIQGEKLVKELLDYALEAGYRHIGI